MRKKAIAFLSLLDYVGLIIPSVWQPFFAEFAFHVENALEKNFYKMHLCNSNGTVDKEREYLQMVMQHRVDGIIGITYSDIDEYISSNFPFVSIDRYFTEDVIYVTADNSSGGRLAAQKLHELGCQHVAYIGGYQDTPSEIANRRKYFELECQELGKECLVLEMLEPIEDLKKEVRHFLTAHPEIDGIFAISDTVAIDVCEVLDQMGRAVPDEVQVIGFDGQRIHKDAPYLVSTIVQPIQEMAEVAVDRLLHVMKGESVPQRTVLPVHYGQGKTTKKLK